MTAAASDTAVSDAAVSEAAQHPAFQPGGAPVSVLIDFDGTISLRDVGDYLLSRFVEDQAAVRRMDQLYVEGRVGSRELTAWDLDVLPHDPEFLSAAVDGLPLDESFLDLVRVVQEAGAAIEIVSDGLGFHVERMLTRTLARLDPAGLPHAPDLSHAPDLPIATNATVLGTGGAGVSFPYGHPACLVCGTCKRERIRRHQQARRAVVFVGDGPSDRYAAHHADVIFAKAALAAWCEGQHIPYQPWHRLADVAEWIEQALSDGRLPADADAFERWAAGARPDAPTFICGPEVWGEGRTTARNSG
jgi:2,3-diketo-5-methylthio-1-phosphopentane phosphatase